MVSEELKVEDAEEGLYELVAVWDGEGVFGDASEHVVAFGDDADDASAAGFDFL